MGKYSRQVWIIAPLLLGGMNALLSQDWTSTTFRHTADDINWILPTSDRTAIAAGSNGLLMRTENAGDTWIYAQTGTSNTIWSVAINQAVSHNPEIPSAGKWGGAVGSKGTFLYTTDNGETWSPRNIGTTADLYGVSVAGSFAVVVGGGGYAHRTTDEGGSWTSVAVPNASVLYAISQPCGSNLVAVGPNGTVVRTTDFGSTWTPGYSGVTQSLNFVAMRNCSNGLAVGGGGVILKTTNGGAQWSLVRNNPYDALYFLCFIDDLRAYCVGSRNGAALLLYTLDGGVSWIEQTGIDFRGRIPISVCFYNGYIGYIGCNDGLIFKAPVMIMPLPWRNCFTPFIQVCYVTPNLIIAIGNGGLILRSADGGNTWSQANSGTTRDIRRFHFADQSVGYAVYENGVLKTIDGGLTWQPLTAFPSISTAMTSLHNYDVVAFDPNNVLVAGGISVNGIILDEQGVLWRSSDGGQSWNSINVGESDGHVKRISFNGVSAGMALLANAGSLGTPGTKVYITSNGGAAWTRSQASPAAESYDIRMIASNTAIAIGKGGKIFRTTDGGGSWEQRTSGTAEDLLSVAFSDGFNGVAGGTNNTLLRTTDAGLTWIKEPCSNNIQLAVRAVCFRGNLVIIGGDYGTICRRPFPISGGNCYITGPSLVDCGSVNLGRYVDRNVVITNPTACAIEIGNISISPGIFSIIGGGGSAVIPAYGSITLVIRCSPAVAGIFNGILVISCLNAPALTINLGCTGVSLRPQIQFNYGTVDFGSVALGGSERRLSLSVYSVGNAPLSVLNPIIGGADASDFSIARACASSIRQGESDYFELAFHPTAVGNRSAILTFTTDDPEKGTITVILTGNATSLARPRLSAAPPQLDFGTVNAGSSSDLNLNLGNSGDAPLVITGQYAVGAGFSIVQNAQSTIQPGGVTAVTVRFSPPVGGAAAGTLHIASNDPAVPALSIPLAGFGRQAAPQATINPDALIFGTVTVGSFMTRSVTIGNSGDAPLVLSDIQLDGSPDFTRGTNGSLTVQPGGSTSLEVRFSPSAAATRNGTLTISANDPDRTVISIVLNGIGIVQTQPRLSISSTMLDFGSTEPGSPVNRELAVSNTGTAVLTITEQAVTGEGFSLIGFAPASIEPGKSATLLARFNPVSSGQKFGTLRIGSNDPTNPAVQVELRGIGSSLTGGEPRVALSRSTVSFGDSVEINKAVYRTLAIRNIGGGTLTVQSWMIGGEDPLHFAVDGSPTKLQIPAGDSAEIRIRHLPLSLGVKFAALQVKTNDLGYPGGNVEVSLVSRKVVTDIATPDQPAPGALTVGNMHPNPAHGAAILSFTLGAGRHIDASLHSVTGEKLRRLVSSYYSPGVHGMTVDTDGLPAGLFYIILRSSDGAVFSRPVLVR